MNTRLLLTLTLFASVSPALALAGTPADKVSGDYVEARTASVFAGACHYNGELVTTGREAVAAWNITSGAWKGTDLTGVRAMAAVTSQASLGDGQAARQSELVVDTSATAAQASALADLLRSKCSATLGQIVAIRRAPVTFHRDGRAYAVNSDGFAALSVHPMANDECCTQPSLVWYSPLVALDHRKVGFTETAAYTAGTLGDAWQRSEENSAFYGAFTF